MILNNDKQITILSTSNFEKIYQDNLVIQCIANNNRSWRSIKDAAKQQMDVLHSNTMEILAYKGTDEGILELKHKYQGIMSGVARTVKRLRDEARMYKEN